MAHILLPSPASLANCPPLISSSVPLRYVTLQDFVPNPLFLHTFSCGSFLITSHCPIITSVGMVPRSASHLDSCPEI